MAHTEGGKMSYLIPTEEISLAEQYRMRKTAVDMGKARASELFKQSADNLAARDADYITDLILPTAGIAGVTAPPIAGWLTQPLLVIGNWYSVLANNAGAAITPLVPTNQVWVFYKVSQLTVAGPDPVCGLQFRIGAVANLKAFFDMEAINGKLVSDGYFSMPITYENPDVVTINVECRVALGAGVGARVRLGTFIIEPKQATVI